MASEGSDRAGGERRGSIGLVLLVAVVLIGAAVGLMFVGRDEAQPYVLGLLAVLGMIGVFSLFATAAGILQVAGKDRGNPILKALADGAIDGIAVTDPSGRVVYANAAYRALTDAAGTGDARPVERVFLGDPEVSEAIYRLVKAAREGRRLQEEVRVGGQRGEPARWLRMRVRPLGEGGREARTAVWSIADVTRERDRNETAFQGLQHAIDYLDHAPAGFFSVDASGHVGYLNATLAGWLDYDLAQIGSGGLKLGDIVPGESAALFARFSGEPGEVKTEVLDLDLKTRGGTPLPVRLYHKVAFAADGTPGASRTLVLNRSADDGTDPQRAAEVRFFRFFHNTPLAIATVDASGRIVRNNALAARLFAGILKGEAQGRSILNVVNPGDRAALETAIGKAARGQGDVAPIDAVLAGEGGKPVPDAGGEDARWARFYVTPIEDAQGDHEAAIVYALDTTEQRILEHRYNQAQKMESVGELAGGLAHDFNNLLLAIMLATDFLLTTHRPTDPSFQDIMQIKNTASRAAGLVQQLLAFARKQTMRPQVLDLGDALGDLSVMLRRMIGEKVTLDVIRSRDLWRVKVDGNQFHQVIVNLAVNAGHAMPDGGKLTLRAVNVATEESRRFAYKGMPAADYVLVEVADTGSGIAPDIMDKIFLPFFSTKEVGKGTGLGLSTVYGIIKQTGGFIYPESEIGKGTTFRIFLPRHVAGAEEAAATPQAVLNGSAPAEPARPAAAADDTGQGTILLVEDEKDLRVLNARGLASRGYTVLQASNGVEAIEALERHDGDIDLVVSDVVMPEMDGPALLKELRRRRPDLKIIFVSGYAEEAFATNRPEGQHEFLPKPFSLKTLVAKVKETIAS
ncbi:MAG TPA: PAS domain-containing protein [Xanthobacteraceae bacterium]|nr:PAS domain-containing protein [Xanthobacteraceae bacterium]